MSNLAIVVTDGFQIGNSVDSESSESESAPHSGPAKLKEQGTQHAVRVSDGDSLGGPVPLSAALHKPASYYQLKQIHMDRLKKTSSNHSPGQSGKKAARYVSVEDREFNYYKQIV